jgi:diaminohydroxyphosphoribosylaminopyrimidine deaminase/5-amino-6-(5-phosphoribosylamino)uracil reductase
MKRALALAAKGRGTTSPNPMVGAVIVKSGRIVAEGYHQRPGNDHAEIVALKQAKNRAAGATLFVTLEPCCHTGRTGPCCDAIIAAGIKQVVYAVKDPDPRVNGRGARRLRAAGVRVQSGLLAPEAEQLNEFYLTSQRLKRPFVILKLAQSLDGRIATATGDSRWISSAQSRRVVHQIRAEVDAVMIGGGTARKDDPQLTVRLARGRNPYRIVVAGTTPVPRSGKLISMNGDGKTIIVRGKTKSDKGRRLTVGKNPLVWEVKSRRNGQVDLHALLGCAREFGIRSIMVEGGAALATSFLRERLVDKFILFTAPIIVGKGTNAIESLGTQSIKEAVSFSRYSLSASGRDWVFVGYPKWVN